ncbi:hypothetical protein DFQ27_006138 [Actinomortierella ambigua]|uniref:Uncharacterized protein n=1 Tax=Actinomortierella ambigua TaxID=1343610 RepID=A0A9P6UC31_9FUNG|nr:hypothetical protein DFQ27_006138 [Actinomortierella ambigua]
MAEKKKDEDHNKNHHNDKAASLPSLPSAKVPESALLGMTGFRRKFNAQNEMETQHDPLMKGNLGSLYDEWGQGHIPASTDMKNHLRPWAVLGGGTVPELLVIQTAILV